jgi:hypothetical protein
VKVKSPQKQYQSSTSAPKSNSKQRSSSTDNSNWYNEFFGLYKDDSDSDIKKKEKIKKKKEKQRQKQKSKKEKDIAKGRLT